ncbi:MAG TPA: signal peptide peptidase SppA [Pseudogracilibacillus sp.]|nr:signal peptide peptidase SppA [Pseudogracilibacillus sp.]
MKSRRMIALLIAIVLIVVSIGVRITTSIASGVFDELLKFDEFYMNENVLRDGSLTEKIVVITLDGAIMSEENIFISDGYNHEVFLNQLQQAFSNDTVDAIVLHVNSPGGAVYETAEIHQLIVESKEMYDKPIYVSMGSMAASGGYYVAAPADKIYAHSSTLTGSIGVIMESINYAELAENHGVKWNTITSGKHKDIMSPNRDMTKEEEKILQSMIDEMYDEFVNVIVEGRGLDEDTVRKIGDGRIYTGKQAKEVDLVDEVGTLDDTIDGLIEDYGFDNPTVVEYTAELGFFDLFAPGIQSFFNQKSDFEWIRTLLTESDQPRALYMY